VRILVGEKKRHVSSGPNGVGADFFGYIGIVICRLQSACCSHVSTDVGLGDILGLVSWLARFVMKIFNYGGSIGVWGLPYPFDDADPASSWTEYGIQGALLCSGFPFVSILLVDESNGHKFYLSS
jgi:hypothetical protein